MDGKPQTLIYKKEPTPNPENRNQTLAANSTNYYNPRCNEETRTIKAVPIFVWNFDPISWKNYQIWSNFRQTEN